MTAPQLSVDTVSESASKYSIRNSNNIVNYNSMQNSGKNVDASQSSDTQFAIDESGIIYGGVKQ